LWNTGTLHIKPVSGDASGSPYNSVRIRVRDSQGLECIESEVEVFTLVVNEPAGNQPPTLDTTFSDITVYANQIKTIPLAASDDSAGNLTFDVSTDPGFVLITDAWPRTATLWIGPHENHVGETYTVGVRVRDAEWAWSDPPKTFEVTVPNRAPTMPNITNKSMDEGKSLYVYVTTANDPDGNPLNGSVSNAGGVSWSWEQSNKRFKFTADYNDSGTKYPTVTISDGHGKSVSDSFTLTVNDVNRDPDLDNITNKSTDENVNKSVTASADDPDGDNITYEWDVESGISYGISGTGGKTITFYPNYSDAGEYTVDVTAKDGRGGDDTDRFYLTVNDKNRKPTLTTNFSNVTMNMLTLKTIGVEGTDPDGDNLTFRIDTNYNPGFVATINIPGAAWGTVELGPHADDCGEDQRVGIYVEDSKGGKSATKTFYVDVNDHIKPGVNITFPVFSSTKPIKGQSYTARGTASDIGAGVNYVYIKVYKRYPDIASATYQLIDQGTASGTTSWSYIIPGSVITPAGARIKVTAQSWDKDATPLGSVIDEETKLIKAF